MNYMWLSQLALYRRIFQFVVKPELHNTTSLQNTICHNLNDNHLHID